MILMGVFGGGIYLSFGHIQSSERITSIRSARVDGTLVGCVLMAPSLLGRKHSGTDPNPLSGVFQSISVGGDDTVCELRADGTAESQDTQ